jgi:ankyrin repeat protein
MQNSQKQLFAACQRGETEVALNLIQEATDLNIEDTNGLTPLFYVARQGYFAIVKALVDKGANVNAKSAFGITPLHGVASVRKMIDHLTIPPEKHSLWRNTSDVINTVDLLLANGADVNSMTIDGRKPIDFSRANANVILIDILAKRMKEVERANGHENNRN